MKAISLLLLTIFICCGSFSLFGVPPLREFVITNHMVACRRSHASSGKKIVIVLVGDSTMADRTGWGLGFKQFVDPNKARVSMSPPAGAVP